MSKIKLKKIVPLGLIYGLLTIFLLSTDPNKMPIGWLMVPFVLIFLAIYFSSLFVQSAFVNVKLENKRKKRWMIAFIIATVPTLILLLDSIDQLTAKDSLLIIILGSIAIFYTTKVNIKNKWLCISTDSIWWYNKVNMNDKSGGYQPGPDLPVPHYESGVSDVSNQNQEDKPHKAETDSMSAEMPQSSPVAAVSTVQPPTVPIIPPPLPADNSAAVQSGSLSPISPPVAEDNDIIEKEWVSRAKAIVEHTKQDPHLQNKEINKFKADYIKKRYNREIKVSED